MNRRLVTVLAVFCGMMTLGTGIGCEDAEARERAEVQSQIADARAQFQRASLSTGHPDDEHAEQVRSELNRVISSLQGVTGGEPGQQAARSMLMAEAQRELSIIAFREIDEIENEHQMRRQIVRNKLLGLRRLAAARQAREAVTAERHREELSEVRRATDEQLRQLQRELERVAEPIADLSGRNERDFARAEELREQATEKMRRSEELGPADGFDLFEEAISIMREADLIEFRASLRELELLLEHEPRRDRSQRQVETLEALKEQVQAAIRDLESFDQIYASAASKLRDRLEEGRRSVRESVDRIAESMKDELASAYEQATQHMERAASQARQAATQVRGDEANVARLVEARTQESLGRLYWRQASGISSHLAMLAALVASGPAIGDTQTYQAMVRQFAEQHETLIEQAKEAHERAKSAIDMLSGAAVQQAAQYRQNLETLMAAMEGEQVDLGEDEMTEVAPVEDVPAAPSRTVAPGDGFDSPEALVAFLRDMDEGDTAAIDRLVGVIHAETRLGRAYKTLLGSVMRATADLMEAVESHFGAAALSQLEQAAGGASASGMGFSDVTLVDQADDRATATYRPMPGMPEESMDLVNINGAWFIDGDTLGDDEMHEPGMEEFGAAMMEQMSTAMSQQISEIARRVRAGDFATIEEFMQTMMQMMMQGMQDVEGMEGMPGMP